MKKAFSLYVLSILSFLTIQFANAQVDCGCTNCPVAITDNGNFNANIFIQNTGPNILGVNNCLESVCFTVTHTWIGDLDFTLTAPDGTCYIIMGDANNNAGGCGSNCDNLNVCINVGTGNPAGTGATEYATLPNGGGNCVNGTNFTIATGVTNPNGPCNSSTNNLNAFNNGTGTVSGVWTLTIGDNCGLDTGQLTDWSVNFCDESGIDCSSTPLCLINNFTANIGACNPGSGTYTANGTISFSNPPGSGSLVVEDCDGNIVFNDPFPWPGSGNVNYTTSAMTADGAPCDLTAYFTADPGCVLGPLNYTAPSCPCAFTFISTNIGACDPSDNTFDITGQLQFQNAPSTGTLTVSDCNGNQQVFNAPFASPLNYTLANIDSDGTTNCTVSAVFSANPACNITSLTFDYPSGCVCTADAGTFTDDVSAGTTLATGPYPLCFGDQVDIVANGDYTPPQDFSIGGITYDPGIWLAVYDCPPTVTPPTDINTDPCLIGFYPIDAAWGILNNVGDGSTLYFVPITMYSMTDNIYAISINGGNWCYDIGPTYEVTYLPEITSTVTTDCAAGTATATINGGLPSFNGSSYTASNLTPATASFGNTTTTSGGTITINGLVDGDNFSFEIVDANGCPEIVTGSFQGLEDPSFSYPQNAYCQNVANPTATVTGTTGGTFTAAPAGMVINAGTGQVNLAASTPGTYTITYTTPDPICFDQATFVLTINPQPVVDGNDETICLGQSVTLNGTGANTYVWSGGVTNGVAFTPGATQTYTVTGTVTATGCSNVGNATVTVNPLDNPSFTTTNYCAGTPSPAATITGTAGGTFAYNPNPVDGSTVNPATGSITNGVGGTTYTLQYTTAGACPQSSTQTVTVYALPVVDVPDYSVCSGGTVTLTATGANTYSWSPGTFLSATTGASVNYTAGSNQVYTVTGTDANGCVDTDITSVTVLANAPINAGADQIICLGESANLLATGGISYNWLAPISAAGAAQTVSPATTTTYTVTGVDAQGCNGSDQVTITVNPLPTATINGTTTVCVNDAQPSITFTGANGTAPYTFTYNINGGANQTVVSVGANATINVPTAASGTFTYNLVSVQDASVTSCDQTQVGSAVVTVNPLPTATINGTAAVCLNGTSPVITFTGANGTAPYTVTYNINGGANQTVVSVGNSATINAPTGTVGTFNYNLISVQDASATACSQAQAGTATITVNPLPTATINGTIDVCNGDPQPTITLTGANGTAPYTFTYNINGGANQTVVSVGNSATLNVSTATNGSFTYNLISVQDASSTACSQNQVGSATVVVSPLPTATIAGTVSVCQNSGNQTITFTGANGTAPYTFTYTINGGANQTVVSVGNSATVNASSATVGTFTYNLVSVEDSSPASCSQNQAGSATVTVNPLPTATINGTTAVCENDPQPSITFTGANGTAPYTFSYNINGGPTQTVVSVGNSATITVPTSPTGTFNYNLLSVQDASSTACSQPQAGTATITVNPNPVPVINGDSDYCAGSTATLFTTQAYSTYNWSTGAVTPSINVTIADNPITVTVSNAFGCVATSAPFNVSENVVLVSNTSVEICQGDFAVIHGNNESVAGVYSQTFILPTGCDSTSNVTLVVNPLPVINAGADFAVCDTDPITLNATGAPTIVWNNGVTNGIAFTQPVGSVLYTATGTDANGCVNTDDIQVTVNPLPTATINGTTAVCVNAAQPVVTFTGANGTAPYTFTYNINGGANQTVVSVGNSATVNAPTGTAGTFNYNLVGVQDASSTTCSQAQVGTATITVNPLPAATVNGTTSVCVNGTQPTITFTGANGTAPYTFTYNINGGANQTVVSVGNSATVNAPTGTAGTFNYNLVSVQDGSSTACIQAQVGTATITVNPLPTATVNGTTAVCVNAAQPVVTFTGANGTAPYTFTYNINGGANQTVVSVGNSATINAPTGTAGTFNYNLVSVQDASSTACVQAQVGTATITVNPLPTATVNGTVSVCVNGTQPTITFTGANGTAPYTFTYNINGGANQTVVSVGNSTTVNAPTGTAGTFNYNLVSVQDGSSTACVQAQVGTATVTVNPLPTATVSGTTAVCVNAAQPIVTFTGANGSSPYTFTYNINGGANQTVVSVGNSATVNAPTGTAGTFNYNLVSVQDASSTACVQVQVGTATITVNPLPTATISGTNEVCVGGNDQTITFTGANGTAPYTFSYTVNGGAAQFVTSVGNSATVTIPASAVGTFVVDLIGVQDASSTACSQAQSGTATITVNPLPNVFAGNDFLICEGETAVLTGSGAVNYVWNNGVVDGVSFSPNATNTYTVTGTDANGCVNTDQVTMTVSPLPIVSFVADVTSGCAPLTVTFTNTTPDNLSNCIWTFGNGTSATGCGTITTTFNQAGLFDVTLTTTTTDGCVNSVTYTDYIYVEAVPIASFTPSSSVLSVLDTEVDFNNTSVHATDYLWDFGDESPNSTAENPSHTYPNDEPGTYIVELIATSPLGCADTVTRVIVIEDEVIFYVPNTFTPDGDDFNEYFQAIFTSGYDPYDFNLYIFNRWGELIWESHDASVGWDGTYGEGRNVLVQDGTYTWKIDFKTTTSDERIEVVGHVNIVR